MTSTPILTIPRTKRFCQTLLVALLVSTPLLALADPIDNNGLPSPPRVHFISLSSAYDENKIPRIIDAFSAKGYQIDTTYLHQYVSDLGYVDVDAIRAENLVAALTDDSVNILWAVRGGGGALNLLPYLQQHLPLIRQAKPKTMVGFSDVTAIHMFVTEHLPAWRSVHGIVANYAQELDDNPKKTNTNDQEPIPNIPTLLANGVAYKRLLPLNETAKSGSQGILIGGNLELLRSTFGTSFSPTFTNRILVLEDVSISYRQLDRMLTQLTLHHRVKDVAGVIIGQTFPLHADDGERLIFKRTAELFAERFDKPVYYFPSIGHGRKNRPVLMGANAIITCSGTSYCEFSQAGQTGHDAAQ